MKNPARFLALGLLALLPALVTRAQSTYTSASGGGAINPSLISGSAIQTFSGFSNISNVSWTVNNSAGAQFASFNLYYAEWNVGGGIINSSLTAFGTTSSVLMAGTSDVFSFTDSVALNPALTYVLVLSNSFSSAGSGLNAASGVTPGAPDATFFGTGGIASVGANDLTGGLSTALSSPTAITTGYAYQMSVDGTASSPSPVPEPKTAAAGIAALFVAALVGRRIMLRRKLATVPLAA